MKLAADQSYKFEIYINTIKYEIQNKLVDITRPKMEPEEKLKIRIKNWKKYKY